MNFLLLFAIGCLVLLPFVLFAKGKLLIISIGLSYLWMFGGLLYLILKLLALAAW